ncbi:POLH1 [Auxenochlorella protothecoides x Auxenochlorella symbiontica]|uniref:UmuC domain-containing protein n=1 Tax=Auxenochlorella protothecoides TaxID=3075 RepID=A0A1D2AF01_AUXPR
MTQIGHPANHSRVILHIDFDCYYAQVEQKRLGIPRDTPCAVQQWEGLIAINYAARARGITRHMRVHEARARVPELVLVHVETVGADAPHGADAGVGADPAKGAPAPNRSTQKASLERYRRSTAEVLTLLHAQLPGAVIEKASIDEVYIDVTAEVERALSRHEAHGGLLPEADSVVIGGPLNPGSEFERRLGQGAGLAARLRAALFEQLGYTSSAGIASNKLLAKVASAMNKPNRQTIVPPRAALSLMQNLPLPKLRNFGGKLGDSLAALGCATAGDVLALAPEVLERRFGPERAAFISAAVQGISMEPVKAREVTKSMLAAKTFYNTRDLDVIKSWFVVLANELAPRLGIDAEENLRRPKNLTIYYRTETDGEHSRVFLMPRFPPGQGPSPQVLAEAAYSYFLTGCMADALPCSRLALSATDFTPVPAAGTSAITRFLSAPAQRQQGHAIRAEARSALGNDAPDAAPHEAAAPGAILAANSRSPGGSGGGAEARAPSTAGGHSSEGPVGSEEDPLLAGVDVRQQAALLREAAMLRTLRNAPYDSSRGAAGKSGKRKADSQHSITRFFGQGS